MTSEFKKCRNCPSPVACRGNGQCAQQNYTPDLRPYSEPKPPEVTLVVTRGGKPVEDQRQGVRDFMAACGPAPVQRSYCMPFQPAVAATCTQAHRFYHEANKPAQCPYCLIQEAHKLRERMHRARLYATVLNEALDTKENL